LFELDKKLYLVSIQIEGVVPIGDELSDDDNDQEDQNDGEDKENFNDVDDLDNIPENMDTDVESKGGKGPRGTCTSKGNLSGSRNLKFAAGSEQRDVDDHQTLEMIAHLYEGDEEINADSDEQILKWEQFLENRSE
jgi:hypothetical protein